MNYFSGIRDLFIATVCFAASCRTIFHSIMVIIAKTSTRKEVGGISFAVYSGSLRKSSDKSKREDSGVRVTHLLL